MDGRLNQLRREDKSAFFSVGWYVFIQWLASKDLLDAWLTDMQYNGRADDLNHYQINYNNSWSVLLHKSYCCPAYGGHTFPTNWSRVDDEWVRFVRKNFSMEWG